MCRRGALLCGRALLFRTIGLRVETLGAWGFLLAAGYHTKVTAEQQQQQRLVSYDPSVPPAAAVLAGYGLGNPCVLSSEVTVISGSGQHRTVGKYVVGQSVAVINGILPSTAALCSTGKQFRNAPRPGRPLSP